MSRSAESAADAKRYAAQRAYAESVDYRTVARAPGFTGSTSDAAKAARLP